MNEQDQMIELIEKLEEYNHAYYDLDQPLVSDRIYDQTFDELAELEKKTGMIMASSPTQKVSGGVISELKKVQHVKPMLSAAKSKDIEVIKKFVKDGMVPENSDPGRVVISWKEDGLTIVLRYHDGKLVQAITRGNGIEGEDVTHTVRRYKNVPLVIPCKDDVEVRGEGVVSLKDFKEYNETHEDGFSHPRNMAAGSTRVLDPEIAASRNLSFVAFELITPEVDDKPTEYRILDQLGFKTVDHIHTTLEQLEEDMKPFNPADYEFPVDGLIIEHEDKVFGRSLGATGHHENCRIALKWADDTYRTKFLSVIRRTTRTGMVSLTAQFEPVMIDGSKVEHATLHNLTFFRNLELGVGDEIEVYKANMIIPCIDNNRTRSNSYKLDMTCPCCGAALEIHIGDKSGTETLHCPNPDCSSKKAAQFEHFVSKPAANIAGVSGSKLEDLLDYGFIHKFADLYHLEAHKDEISALDGWGARSFEKLQTAIENSRKMDLSRFLVCFGIPQVGKHAGKDIDKYFLGDPNEFMHALKNGFDFHALPDFGDVMCENLVSFFDDPKNMADWNSLLKEYEFQLREPEEEPIDSELSGKSIVATGTFQFFSRNGINRTIEKMGGLPKGSVSKKTDLVIAGMSAGSKMQKAMDLGIKVINEEQFLSMLGVDLESAESVADRN